MSRILILGATGLLGVPLANALRHKLEVITQGRSKCADYQADLSCIQEAGNLLNFVKPDIVINLVALTDVDRCEIFPNEAYRINTKTVENLAECHSANHHFQLIQISTDQVYDDEGTHDEEDVTLTNIYAYSKYCAEKVATSIGGVVLRTNFFGPSQVLGRVSFSDWVIDSFRQKKKIKLFKDVYFSPLSINTLIKCIERVIELPQTGVYNLGSHHGMSKQEFALNLGYCLGLDTSQGKSSSVKDFTFKAYRPTDMRMDSRRFEKVFDVTLPKLIDEIGNAV